MMLKSKKTQLQKFLANVKFDRNLLCLIKNKILIGFSKALHEGYLKVKHTEQFGKIKHDLKIENSIRLL